MCVCVCVYVCVYIYVCIYILCVYINKCETHRSQVSSSAALSDAMSAVCLSEFWPR